MFVCMFLNFLEKRSASSRMPMLSLQRGNWSTEMLIELPSGPLRSVPAPGSTEQT